MNPDLDLLDRASDKLEDAGDKVSGAMAGLGAKVSGFFKKGSAHEEYTRSQLSMKDRWKLSKSVVIWIPRRSLNTFKCITVADLMNPDLACLIEHQTN